MLKRTEPKANQRKERAAHLALCQGGASEGGVGLTAYTLLALLESGVKNDGAVKYLEAQLEGIR